MASGSFRVGGRADVKEWERYLSDFQRRLLPGVIVSTLTGTAREIRTELVEKLKSSVGATAGEIRKRVRLKRASPGEWHAAIYVNKKAIVLRRTPSKPNPYDQARKGRRVVRYGAHTFPKGFTANVDGTPIVLHRTGGRLIAARVYMEPTGSETLGALVDGKGAKVFQRIGRERLARALRRGNSLAGERAAAAIEGG